MLRLAALSLAAVSLAASLLAGPALADTISVSTTIDVGDIPTGPGFVGVQGSPPFFDPFSVVLAEGDIFDFTIDFVGSQELTLTNVASLWAFSYATTSSEVTGTGTLYLLDAFGAVLYTSDLKTSTEGDAHFGQYFTSSDFSSLPASITIGGLRYIGTVDDYLEDGVTERTYDTPAFYFDAEGATGTSPVPEPETYATMLAGLGLIGFLGRRSRQRNLATA